MTVSIEERLARLEGAYEQIDRRLGSLEQQVGQLREEVRSEVGEVRQELGRLRQEVRAQLYFILTFMAATFGGLLSAILATR